MPPKKFLLVSSFREKLICVVLLNPVNWSVLSAKPINFGMRVREFYQNEFTNDFYIIKDEVGFYNIHFESMPKFM